MLAPDGSFKPLGFYSAHLTETQKKYSVFKKELLGAFKSLRHSLPEIYGRHCTIYVDHLPLVQAFKSSNLPLNDPQSYRQITEIGRFTNDVRPVSGVDNIFADFSSRITEENKTTRWMDPPPLPSLRKQQSRRPKWQRQQSLWDFRWSLCQCWKTCRKSVRISSSS